MILVVAYSKSRIVILLCFALVMAGNAYGEVEQTDISSELETSDSTPKRELLVLEDIPVVVVTPARVEQSILESQMIQAEEKKNIELQRTLILWRL